MTFNEVQTIIFSRVNTSIKVGMSIPVQYPNVVFDKPISGTYCAITILTAETQAMAIGGKRTRLSGILVIQIFSLIGIGDATALSLCDDIISLFTQETVSGVRFQTPFAKEIGRSEEWYQVNVQCPFFADAVST